jgi:hypothetical protein
MLTCHPEICVPPEGPFFYCLEPKYGHIAEFDNDTIERFVDDLFNVNKMEEWNLDRASLIGQLKAGPRNTFAALVDGVYREYMKTMGKVKRRWGDKSGSYTIGGLDSIRRSLSHAFILHIVRDGRDVACSYRSLQGIEGKYAPRLPTGPLEIAYAWKKNVNRIGQFLGGWPQAQQAEVRYEDLVTSPVSTLKTLCAMLGEAYDPSMLDFHRQNAELALEPKLYLGWKQKTLEKITDSRVGRWQAELSETDVRLFEALAGDLLRHYNYPPSETPDRRSFDLLVRIQSRAFLVRKMLGRIWRSARIRAAKVWRSIQR